MWRAPEAVRMSGVGGGEDFDPLGADFGCGAEVDRRCGVQSDAGMAMFMVVVAEELLAEAAGVGE